MRTAIIEKEASITKNLKEKGLTINNLNILLIAYKGNDELEIYAKKKMKRRMLN